MKWLFKGKILKPNELETWQKIIEEIKLNIPQTAHVWLSNLECALPLNEMPENNIFLLKSNQSFGVQFLNQKYLPEVEEALEKYTQLKRSVRIVFDEQIKPKKKVQKQPKEFIPQQEQFDNMKQMHSFCGLNLKYTFNNFVSGKNTKFAFESAKIVAKNPGQKYNPLYIYGDVGLGKTHLMQAIGHDILKNFPTLKVKYAKAEEITNLLTESSISPLERNSKMQKFRDKFRNIDVLLLDDIQFAQGKKRTEEEIFNIFDALFYSHKQIVFASDRKPSNLSATHDRLKSRYEWGLSVEIEVPDLENRIEIIKNFAIRSDYPISDELAEFLAQNFDKNIRELEGAYNKISAYGSIENIQLDIETASKILGLDEKKIEINSDLIIEKCAKYFGIKKEDIKSTSRAKEITNARRFAMYLTKELTDKSLNEIGKIFDKNHTTVMYSVDKIKDSLATDKNLQKTLKELKKFISD